MWQRLQKPDLRLANTFSERIWQMEERRPGNFPEFRSNEPLQIYSDYSGSHCGARFDAYSYLLVQSAGFAQWEQDRRSIRQAYGMERRRFAYKALNDQVRAKALWPWLVAADDLPGLLVTVLIDKSLGSLFPPADFVTLKTLFPEFSAVKPATIERIFRVCHFLSMFVAGLSAPGQHLHWVSDEDEIAANESRLQLLAWTFTQVCTMYLGRVPAHVGCDTTGSDDGSLQLEDLASLPDLVAGALTEVQTQQIICRSMPESHTPTPIPASISPKAQPLLHWLSLPDRALRRMVFAVWPAPNDMLYMNKIVFLNGLPDGGVLGEAPA
ncbi:MAG: hypothetical protein HYV95_13865 [Opitutae bacterium]|nr:hypothetical protein [Opitutae bacterium]